MKTITDKTITVSAPGKLVLFGEHAVVHGKPCIVTSVDQRLKIRAQKLPEPVFHLEAPDVDVINYQKPISQLGKGTIPKGAQFVEIATRNFIRHVKRTGHGGLFPTNTTLDRKNRVIKSPGVKFQTVSQFKSVFGFGSSSASAVCTVKALSELFRLKLTPQDAFKIAHKTVLDIAGVGSGFDLAAATYGDTLYFITPGKVIEPLKLKGLPLIVGYTGVKFDTPTLVKQVNAQAKKYPKLYKMIFNQISDLVDQAKVALRKNDLEKVGELMNLNQGLLDTLGVNSNILSKLIYAARDAGAYGAKLSGAGGGDCMIALAPENKRRAVEKAIEAAGGQIIKVEVNTEGVKVEK